jgi:hypothetical protein
MYVTSVWITFVWLGIQAIPSVCSNFGHTCTHVPRQLEMYNSKIEKVAMKTDRCNTNTFNTKVWYILKKFQNGLHALR